MKKRSFLKLAALLLCALVMGGKHSMAATKSTTEKEEVALFAGGCFWCMEKPFDQVAGVLSTTVGYTGGTVVNPTYEQVSAGHTGHLESVRVTYDPATVSYQALLKVFWRNVDPFDGAGQFCDHGSQYRAAIFYLNDEQKRLAEQSKQEVAQQFGKDVTTDIIGATPFYPAEEYHQHYYQKNPIRYAFYRSRCGRDARLEEVWGKNKE